MKAVIGLGNPDEKYRGTRHNVGFAVLDRLAEKGAKQWRAPERRKKDGSPLYEARRPSDEAKAPLLVKPLTYMNRSGVAVKEIAAQHGLAPSDMLIVCDEIQLRLGTLKLNARGSSGGHNGLQSVVDETGGTAFPRLRIGIGWDPKDLNTLNLAEFVLGSFVPEEKELIERSLDRAAEACWLWFHGGIEAAMNRFNAKTT